MAVKYYYFLKDQFPSALYVSANCLFYYISLSASGYYGFTYMIGSSISLTSLVASQSSTTLISYSSLCMGQLSSIFGTCCYNQRFYAILVCKNAIQLWIIRELVYNQYNATFSLLLILGPSISIHELINKWPNQYSIIIKFSKKVMLFKSHKINSPQSTFTQQLSYLKNNGKISTNITKNSEYYKAMASILDLLLAKYPATTSEILILKQSLKKWYEHLSEEANNRNREILRMKDDALVNVSREIGTVLQQIGYYVKYLTQRYEDQDMKKLYTKYLRAIAKLQWNQGQMLSKDIETQTQIEEIIMMTSQNIPTFKSIKLIHHPHSGSDLTLDSLPGSYKTIEQDRYVRVKQQNLQLQRKMDRIQSKINQLQNQNRELKTQIDRLFLQNQELNTTKDKSLSQVNKLKSVLQCLKTKEEQENQLEQTKRKQFEETQSKYEHFNQIRTALHRTLQNAEQEIIKNQSAKQLSEPQQYLNNNFTVSIDDKYKTLKKGALQQQKDASSEFRMMLLQAFAIQSFLKDSSFQYQ